MTQVGAFQKPRSKAQLESVLGIASLTDNRLVTVSSGALANSLIAQGTITGALTVSKSGSTAREVTFPDAALTVAGTNIAQTYTAVQTYGTGLLVVADVKASGSGGGALQSNNGTNCLTWGAGGGANVTTADGLAVTGSLAVNGTTDASSTTTGSLQTDGGLGVVKAAHIGTTLTVGGALSAGATDVDSLLVGQTFAVRVQGDRASNTRIGLSVPGTSAFAEMITVNTGTPLTVGFMGFTSGGNFELYNGSVTKILTATTTGLTVGATGTGALSAGATTVTSVTVTSGTRMIASTAAFTDGAGASAGTLTNAPSAGDPTKWIAIDDNGTTRYIPAW